MDHVSLPSHRKEILSWRVSEREEEKEADGMCACVQLCSIVCVLPFVCTCACAGMSASVPLCV